MRAIPESWTDVTADLADMRVQNVAGGKVLRYAQVTSAPTSADFGHKLRQGESVVFPSTGKVWMRSVGGPGKVAYSPKGTFANFTY